MTIVISNHMTVAGAPIGTIIGALKSTRIANPNFAVLLGSEEFAVSQSQLVNTRVLTPGTYAVLVFARGGFLLYDLGFVPIVAQPSGPTTIGLDLTNILITPQVEPVTKGP